MLPADWDGLYQSLYGMSLGIESARCHLARSDLDSLSQALNYLSLAAEASLRQLRCCAPQTGETPFP